MSTYEKHRFSDSKLPFIIHSTHYTAQKSIDPVGNWHENVELLVILKGKGVIRLNERSIAVCGGDVAVVNQNVIHSILPSGELLYYCIIVDRSFCLSNYFDTNAILFQEHIRDEQLFSSLCSVAEEYLERRNEPFGIQAVRSGVLCAMTELCRRYGNAETDTASDSHLNSCMRQALGCISSESHRDISLGEIADFVGLSKYYFAREFKKVTGYTFVSYLNVVRCEKAKLLLTETTRSIGDVSAECGFSDQSYFTRVFKKHVGVLPAEFRRSVSS